MGSKAYRIAGDLTYEPRDVILEVGTDGGEGSTAYFASLAVTRDLDFVSIDPDPDRTPTIVAKAEDVLVTWDRGPIRFAYLDGADWPYSWHFADPQLMQSYNERYARWGGELSQGYSADSHLQIVKLLSDLCTPEASILFDDTWYEPRIANWWGKGMTAVPYLQDHGWTLGSFITGHEPTYGYVYMTRYKGGSDAR